MVIGYMSNMVRHPPPYLVQLMVDGHLARWRMIPKVILNCADLMQSDHQQQPLSRQQRLGNFILPIIYF